MRVMKLEEWEGRIRGPGKGRAIRRRPTADWKIRDSIEYIRRRDRWLEEQDILVKLGPRRYRLNPEIRRWRKI
ncbi:MAG: hypothetical protein ACP5FL_04115 [Thermoplasmatota archaeon]